MRLTLMKCVFLDKKTIASASVEEIKQVVTSLTCYETTHKSEIRDRIAEADIVITNKVPLGYEELEAAKQLKLICVAATGMNNIDLDAAKHHNIQVMNVTNYAQASVSQHVLSFILNLTNNMVRYNEDVLNGQWQGSDMFCMLHHPIMELSSKKLGIIGYGELGKATAKLATAFGMDILVCESLLADKQTNKSSSDVKRIGFKQLLQQADFISLHCPLSPSTHNLIGDEEFKLMKETSYIINTARGHIIDEKALLNALLNNEIAGAALDVLTEEPPTSGNPLISAGLPNLIITPHIAWASRESIQRLVNQVATNIATFRSQGT